jgi:hypothetical protein
LIASPDPKSIKTIEITDLTVLHRRAPRIRIFQRKA